MQTFKVGDLSEWGAVGAGEIMQFPDLIGAKSRSVRAEFITNRMVSVFALTGVGEQAERVLVAYAEGRFDLELPCKGGVALEVVPRSRDAGFECYARVPGARVHTVPASGAPSLTVLDYGRRRSTDLDRIMRLVKINEQERERKVREDRQRRDAQLAALQEQVRKLSEPPVEPAPPPASEPGATE